MNPLERIKAAGCKCGKCPYARDGAPTRPVLPVGPKRPDAVLVGESPSRDDVRDNEPLSGPLRSQLDDLLQAAGLERDRLLLINAVACPALEPKNPKHLRKAALCCRPLLRDALRGIAVTTPVALMGAVAVFAVTGEATGAAGSRGFVDREWDLSMIPQD